MSSLAENANKDKDSDLRGGFWTLLSRILAQFIQFIIFIVAVRIMRPEEFGVFALVAAFVVILNQLSTAGWPEYIMQWHGDSFRPRQTLYIAMLVGLGAAILGIVLSLLILLFSGDPVIGSLALILSIGVLFASVGASYAGIMNWQNKLTAAALCALLGEFANLVVAVWSLLEGHGVLALAYGRLASAIVWSVSGFLVSRMAPVVVTNPALIKEMAWFSWHIVASRFLANLRVYAATFIIGGFLGVAAVGYYRASQRIINAFEEIVSAPTGILAWKLFRKTRNDDGNTLGFNFVAQGFFQALYYGAVPLFVGIAILAPDLTRGILGPEWDAATPLLQILAVAALIRTSGHATVPIISLAGKIGLMPRIMLVYTLISITCVTLGAFFGLIPTAWAEVVAAAIVFIINAWIMRKYVNLNFSTILLRSWPAIPALLLALVFPLLANRFDLFIELPALARFILLGLSMVIVYVPVILMLDKAVRLWITQAVFSRN